MRALHLVFFVVMIAQPGSYAVPLIAFSPNDGWFCLICTDFLPVQEQTLFPGFALSRRLLSLIVAFCYVWSSLRLFVHLCVLVFLPVVFLLLLY